MFLKVFRLGIKVHSLKRIEKSKKIINCTVKILNIGTPEIITIIVLQLEQLDFTVQYCVQKMQTDREDPDQTAS